MAILERDEDSLRHRLQPIAEALGVSKRTVEGDWTLVRAWLRRELTEAGQA